MKIAGCFLFLIIYMISCQISSHTSPDNYHGKQVIISEGGGFTGQTTQYIILENGQVFIRMVYPAGLQESDKLNKSAVREIFSKLNDLNLAGIEFNHPGNMTYSLGFNNGQQGYEVKWGDPAYPVPSSISGLYDFIHDQISQK